MSNASWKVEVSGLSSSNDRLNPDSKESVVSWFSLDNALDDLVEPLVSGLAWFSADHLDEVVNHVLECWSSSWEVSSIPSDVSSLSVVSIPVSHVIPSEGVSDLSSDGYWWLWFWSEIWINWLGWLGWLLDNWWFWEWSLLRWNSWWANCWLWWLFLWFWASSLVEPSLVGTIVAVPEDDVSHVRVSSSMDIKAFTSNISEVSS